MATQQSTYDCNSDKHAAPTKYNEPFYIIVIQVVYKTDQNKFAEDCKAGHDDKIKINNASLTKDIDNICNNNLVSAGPLVITNTETTAKGFGCNSGYNNVVKQQTSRFFKIRADKPSAKPDADNAAFKKNDNVDNGPSKCPSKKCVIIGLADARLRKRLH
ncbi:Hypothetical predicted protein [Mytilus galloprovincialis]|uniref:Uncharacterized protein n=1 Tax=Mytilus galloprovincialis TaxID=29158 RepID=A0A8B6F8X9_MYTGA|nr:Hypothetical predicted protein [Mytilus galloprovincialis]